MKKISLPLLLLFFVVSFFAVAFLTSNRNLTVKTKTVGIKTRELSTLSKKVVLGTTTVDLFPNADTSVWSTNPTTNYGDGGHTLWAGYIPDKLRALIKFDFTSIAPTAIVSAATLNLYQYGASGTPDATNIYAAPIIGSWAELTATWNNRPPYDAVAAVQSYLNTTSGWKNFSVKQITQGWVNGTRNNQGFIIFSSESGTNWHRYFNNRHNANKPYLHITYTIPDLTPPAISSVATSELTKTGVKITWTTNEASTSYVDYGPTASYGSTSGQADSVTSHAVSLSGLTAGTTFHFRVRSKDAANNEAASGDNTFTTATDTSSGTGVATETNTDPTASEPTAAASSLSKKGATSAAGAKSASTETKTAGINKLAITALVAILVIIVVLVAVYLLKFRRGHILKKVPEIKAQEPNEPNKVPEPQSSTIPENKNSL